MILCLTLLFSRTPTNLREKLSHRSSLTAEDRKVLLRMLRWHYPKNRILRPLTCWFVLWLLILALVIELQYYLYPDPSQIYEYRFEIQVDRSGVHSYTIDSVSQECARGELEQHLRREYPGRKIEVFPAPKEGLGTKLWRPFQALIRNVLLFLTLN